MKKILFSIFIISLCITKLNSVYHKVNDIVFEDTSYPEIQIMDDIAYVADHSYGLRIYDISNPAEPVLLNSLPLQIDVRTILLGQPTAYLLSLYDCSMYILDTSDIINPIVLSQYYTTFRCLDVSVNDNYAFISTHHELNMHPWEEDFIEIVNIEDRLNPVYVDDFAIANYCPTVEITNDVAFIGTFLGLYVYDISDINNVVQINWFDTNNTFALKFHNGLLYCDGWYGLTIIDYSDPSNCQILAEYDQFVCNDFEIIEDKLYMASYTMLRVLDISDPMNVYQIGYYVTPNMVRSVAVSQEYAFINSSYDTLHIIDTSEHENPYFYDYYDNYKIDLAKSPDDLLMFMVGELHQGLEFYDMSNPAEPEHLYTHTLPGDEWAVCDFYVDEQICCSIFGSLDGYTLNVYDETQQELTISSITPISYNGGYLSIQGIGRKENHIYIGCSGDGIMILDISDPLNPTQVLQYDIQGYIFDLTVKGDFLYYVSISGFYVFDISDPLQLNQVAYWESHNRAEQLALYQNYAYVVDYDGGIKVFDLSDLTNFVPINTVSLNSTSKIDIDPIIRDDKLIISDKRWNEIMVFDLSDPTNPVMSSNCRWNKYTLDMELFGDFLYCANGEDDWYLHGLSVLDFSSFNPVATDEPIIPNSLSNIFNLCNFPNPFNPTTTIEFSLKDNSNIELNVYNIKGQKVRLLVKDSFDSGTHSIVWDGKDDTEKSVSSGIYFNKLNVNGVSRQISKCILIK
ncbi:MAG: T9SS type A sorting domain-containing protein [Promethearchaeota archaeon]